MQTLTDSTYKDILHNELLSKPKIAIVKVSATWCGPCKLLKNHYERWETAYSSPEVMFYEIDNDSNPEFVNEHKIDSLPTIIFFVYGVPVYYLRGMTRQLVFDDLLNKTKQVETEMSK